MAIGESGISVNGRAMERFWSWDGDVLVLNILGTPGAKRTAIGKVKGCQLKVSVAAAAEDGKATDCMVRFLAKEFGVHVRDIDVVFGRFSVNKQLRIRSPKRLPTAIGADPLSARPEGENSQKT